MKIFIVNDHDVFRQSLKQFIENYLHYEVIGESSDGKDFLDIGYTTADIILMDINMPFVNGLDAAKLIKGDPTGAALSLFEQSKDFLFNPEKIFLEASK